MLLYDVLNIISDSVLITVSCYRIQCFQTFCIVEFRPTLPKGGVVALWPSVRSSPDQVVGV